MQSTSREDAEESGPKVDIGDAEENRSTDNGNNAAEDNAKEQGKTKTETPPAKRRRGEALEPSLAKVTERRCKAASLC